MLELSVIGGGRIGGEDIVAIGVCYEELQQNTELQLRSYVERLRKVQDHGRFWPSCGLAAWSAQTIATAKMGSPGSGIGAGAAIHRTRFSVSVRGIL